MRPAVVVCRSGEWSPRPYDLSREGTCGACGRPLVGRLRWFCRAPAWCRFVWMANHSWTDAKWTAHRRASPTGRAADSRCSRDGCGRDGAYRESPAELSDNTLEVNHINPRRGLGYGLGCHHHQDNLEVLCHPHHVEVTTAQRRGITAEELARGRRAQGVLPLTT